MVDLVIRQRVMTADPAEASDALRSVLGAGAVRCSGTFRYEQRSLVDDGISVLRLACSGNAVEVTSDGTPDLVLLAVRAGRLEFTCRGSTRVVPDGGLALIPFNEACTIRWGSVTLDLYSFPLSAFVRTLGLQDQSLTVRAPFLEPQSPELTAVWSRLADLVIQQVLDRPGVYSNDVVRAQLIDGLTAVTVEAFGLTNQEEDDRLRDDETLRSTDAFMRAHLHEAITVPEIAAAAGVSVRGLQLVCQRRLDRTPIAHLRRIRLDTARLALANPAPDTTVSTIGRRVGYSNLGRFSAHYRDAFGEPPSRTLERHRTDT